MDSRPKNNNSCGVSSGIGLFGGKLEGLGV